MKEYRKTYWPLIVWALALTPVMIGAAKWAEAAHWGDCGMVALMMTAVLIMLLLLFWIIWKGGYVYWINGGPDFEQARDAGREARNRYAWAHLKAMLKGCGVAFVLLAVECSFGAHELLMVLSTCVCIIAAAISTVRIRWMEEKTA